MRMSTQRIRTIYTISLVILDAFLVAVAFVLAYQLRVVIDWPEPLANSVPLTAYTGLLLVQVISIVVALFFYRSGTRNDCKTGHHYVNCLSMLRMRARRGGLKTHSLPPKKHTPKDGAAFI